MTPASSRQELDLLVAHRCHDVNRERLARTMAIVEQLIGFNRTLSAAGRPVEGAGEILGAALNDLAFAGAAYQHSSSRLQHIAQQKDAPRPVYVDGCNAPIAGLDFPC